MKQGPRRNSRTPSARIALLACLAAGGVWLGFRAGYQAGPSKSPNDVAWAIDTPVVAGHAHRTVEPAASAEERPHPHPITLERIRIQHENQLIGALNDAMDLADGPRLRQVLSLYRERYPEDPSQLQEGYGIIVDCLEHPNEETRAAAEQYCDRERGSTLRLFVERNCL